MPELTVRTTDGERRIAFQGTPFLSALLSGLPDAPPAECGGKGVCGRCAVYASGALAPAPDALTIDSDPMMILRPEGAWDRPGILDRSAARPASNPH